MRMCCLLTGLFGTVLAVAGAARGEVTAAVGHNPSPQSAEFKFDAVVPPSANDAGAKAKFTVVDGTPDQNGGGVSALNDGRVPAGEDVPRANFFFAAGTDGGRVVADLGAAIDVKQVNTYSWHRADRGPQVYKLYGSDGTAPGFNAGPKKGTDPATAGWTLVAAVDTRKQGAAGGQHAASVGGDKPLGKFRYLLFDISRTGTADGFDNTFFGEIDVVDAAATEAPEPARPSQGRGRRGGGGGGGAFSARTPVDPNGPAPVTAKAEGGYEIVFDYSATPDLKEWVEAKLVPACVEWYPKIVAMLPSDGYEPPKKFTVTFSKDYTGVAAAAGTRVVCGHNWFRKNLEGEAVGAVVHELVHVVQQYGRPRPQNARDVANPPPSRNPGWLVEGLADYIRWFLFEPESQRPRPNPNRANYDDSYRTTGHFLEYVMRKYDKEAVKKLNAAMREGRYSEDLWKQLTGKTADELGQEWKQTLAAGAPAAGGGGGGAVAVNALTDQEKTRGWKLLFDGKTLNGWHNFKSKGVRHGWQVKDGALTCADPHDAGDIVTEEKFDFFELSLEYNISEGGNSGIMFHVGDEGEYPWQTGPEIQLLDNRGGGDPNKSGWLYAIYTTDKDATKPAGQWNHLRVVIAPEKCEHFMNGTKYFEYVLGGEDFNARVGRSKFGKMPNFAKTRNGRIALQGDHGVVAFRNIRVRRIAAK